MKKINKQMLTHDELQAEKAAHPLSTGSLDRCLSTLTLLMLTLRMFMIITGVAGYDWPAQLRIRLD